MEKAGIHIQPAKQEEIKMIFVWYNKVINFMYVL